MVDLNPAQRLRIIRLRRRSRVVVKWTIGVLMVPVVVAVQMGRLLKRFRRPDAPPAPYPGVREPKRPVLPRRSAAIALEEPE